MPNWVENELTVTGYDDLQAVAKFKEFAKGADTLLDAGKFVPIPKEQLDAAMKIIAALPPEELEHKKFVSGFQTPEQLAFSHWFNHGGYEWCCENWGTKWGIYAENVDDDGEQLFYEFKTAWSPPTPVILAMSKMFPTLRFHLQYFEAGMGFQGEYVAVNGVCEIDESHDYHGQRGG